jgi:hypothetical protein
MCWRSLQASVRLVPWGVRHSEVHDEQDSEQSYVEKRCEEIDGPCGEGEGIVASHVAGLRWSDASWSSGGEDGGWSSPRVVGGSCASKILANKPQCRTQYTHALHLSKTCEDYKKTRQVNYFTCSYL